MTPLKMIFLCACVGALLLASSASSPHSCAQADNSAPSDHPASPPICRSCPQPDFPSEARKAKISHAVVLLDVMISADGQPDDIRVVSDPGYGFADNAVKAVKKWKFKPAATKDGKKVPTRTKIEITFRE
jgi:TonB family protein